jgi:hypothetical protein
MLIDVPLVWFVSIYLAAYVPCSVSFTNRCQNFGNPRVAELLAFQYWQGARTKRTLSYQSVMTFSVLFLELKEIISGSFTTINSRIESMLL